ncbi:CNNM domain-containing protein [Streptomyces sp. NPDC059979]|uniref:CNNM domain-containing protein n=1 Tax=Streptomyces sp. NPDC059979 TaxID=3347021 RepID=UPI003673CFEE
MLNALFAGTEIALISLRESQLRKLRRRGGAAAARLAADPNRYLATIQIGITLAGFLASATARCATRTRPGSTTRTVGRTDRAQEPTGAATAVSAGMRRGTRRT